MPILFLCGTDEFSIARRIAEIAAKTDRDGLNTSRLEARLTAEEELYKAVNALPFLAEKRLVILAHPSQKYTSAEARQKFLAFLTNVPPTTLLVVYEILEEREARQAGKHWLVGWAAEALQAKVETFLLPKPREMKDWIVGEVKRQGGAISSQAAHRLAELVGVDTRQAAQEIAKLLTYVNWSRPIELKDVEAVCVSTAEVNLFDFVDRLAMRQVRASQAMLHKMLEEQDASSIFPLIVRQFRLLIQIREMIEAGNSVQTVQEALGLHPFVASKLVQQAERFTLADLEAIYRRLLEIDEAAKISAMPLEIGLEMFVVELGRSSPSA